MRVAIEKDFEIRPVSSILGAEVIGLDVSSPLNADQVANVSTEGELLGSRHSQSIYQKVNSRWHTDSSYRYIPSLSSIMYGIEVIPEWAPGGGNRIF